MARIDSVYDYYMSTYANKEVSRYDAHKKSELRRVYNSIVKANKESPLYKISNMEEAKKFAIDIKEGTKSIQNVVAALSDSYGGFEDSFQKKVAVSSEEDNVAVKYVGNGEEDNSTDTFSIDVQKLAQPQVNTGNYLKDDVLSFKPGSYSFDLATPSTTYEFIYTVNDGDTNKDVLTRLSNLIASANLGITAEVLERDDNFSALSLTSRQTGLSAEEAYLFNINPDATNDSIVAMSQLGIDKITQEASNSSFTLNGAMRSSLSNTFTINNTFELTLKQPTDGCPATIGFKTNSEAVADNIQTLLDAFNGVIKTAENYADTGASAGNKLFNDVGSVSKSRQASLAYIGLMVADDGQISINKDILAAAVQPDRAGETYQTLTDFKDALGEKAGNVAINPMSYVNKIVVAYKNPGHNFNTPYISSIYAGMMLDKIV